MTHTMLILTTTKSIPRKKMIEEVMLDRWLLQQIEEEYDVMEIDNGMPREELSQDVLELLS